ncbi:MAG TPA: polyribonucleotide nucleotidyltransferase, partial [bacterium]
MWEQSLTLGERKLSFETGKIARQAHGAVVLREGKTVILSTVVYNLSDAERDFLPLTVDYRAYHAAAGRIPGSFNRREGRSTDYEILASRLCDRSLRPLFPDAYRGETQVLSTVLSADPDSDLPVLAMNAAAAALHLSEIPWEGPLAAVRVGRIGGKLVALPSPKQIPQSDMDMVLSVSREGIVMLEGGAKEVPEADVVVALDFARAQLQPVLALMEAMRKAVGTEKIKLPPAPSEPAPITALVSKAR